MIVVEALVVLLLLSTPSLTELFTDADAVVLCFFAREGVGVTFEGIADSNVDNLEEAADRADTGVSFSSTKDSSERFVALLMFVLGMEI